MRLVRKIYDEAVIKRKPPCNIIPEDAQLFGGPLYECKVPASSLVELKNVRVTYHGIILKNLLPVKRFLVYYENDFKTYWKRYVLHVILKMKKQEVNGDKKYLLIFDNYTSANGLAHWFSDGLTRLAEISEHLSEYTALVPDYFKTSPIYTTTLKLFNFSEIQEIKQNSYVTLKNVYVCDHLASTGDYRPENILKIRQLFFAMPGLTRLVSTGSKIYISRKKASRRFVLNEREVEKTLAGFGFETVCMEDHSFEEQLKIAHHADILVSIHGGALSHILLMKKGTSVLEFRKSDDGENCMFYSMADAIGINYYYLSCKGKVNNNIANNFDLEVDIQKLKNTLSLIQSHEKDRY